MCSRAELCALERKVMPNYMLSRGPDRKPDRSVPKPDRTGPVQKFGPVPVSLLSLYDKRRDFSFNVIRLTDSNSNNPRRTGLTVLYSQLIRITRISSSTADMKRDLAQLVTAVRDRGYTTEEIARTFYKLNNSYPTALKRFGLGTKKSVRTWLNTEISC